MLLTRHPWLDTYWQERVKNPFVDFVWYRRFTLQISGLLSRASVRFLIFIKYEKNRCVRSLSVVEVLIGLAFRSATSCCLPAGRLRSLTAASVPPFPPFGRRSLRFESALANTYRFKIKKLPLLREKLFFGDNRTRLSVGNLLLPPCRPAPVADGGIRAAFSSLWSALPTLRVCFG